MHPTGPLWRSASTLCPVLHCGCYLQVAKAEAMSYSCWWQDRAPAGMSLQQLLALQGQQQAAAGAAAPSYLPGQSAGEATVTPSLAAPGSQQNDLFTAVELPTAHKTSDTHQQTPSLLTDNTADHGQSMTDDVSSSSSTDSQQLWRWVLAEIGLAAQQQLASGTPSILKLDGPTTSVAAAAAAGHDVAGAVPGATAVIAAEGTDPQALQVSQDDAGVERPTKNQDPGIPVDAAAIANPGERQRCPQIRDFRNVQNPSSPSGCAATDRGY